MRAHGAENHVRIANSRISVGAYRKLQFKPYSTSTYSTSSSQYWINVIDDQL